ncbi:MAG: HAMP domain-containing sensor histidine kinase [Anaerolineales bacterium]|jgi:signal transduction histidine kinase
MMKPPLSRSTILARYLLGVLLILAVSLVIFTLVMKPPMAEIRLMAVFLLITAIISSLAGYGAYRLGWISYSPALRWTLLAGYALSSVLTFFNVWLTARLMFASQHDLLLAIVLLVFAGGMAMALGYFLSSALTDRIYLLQQGAERLARGELAARVPVSGRDEVAALAAAFNQMASRLQAAAEKQHEVEQLRTDLIAWVGHDLQTPLASIRAILEALADGVVTDPQAVQRYLATAQRAVRSLSELIDDLFQMAQLDAGGLTLDRSDNSLSDLISDTLESFSALAAGQGIALAGSVAADVDPVFMDAARIGRVLSNLVGNALRYTPKGGRVEVHASRKGQKVEVTVSDTGEGIREEDLPYIFDRFYRGEKSRNRALGGAGLGLAIARGILQAHGGEIRAESLPGQGTRFIFQL